MVKPGGTGRPRLAISARLAPLPPSRLRMSARPSALPSPNVKTHLPAFGASAGRCGAFATGLGTAFFRGFLAVAAGFADGFDFAAIFFDFATALSMAFRTSLYLRDFARLPHFGLSSARRGTRPPATYAATAAGRGRPDRSRSGRSRR